MSSDGSSQLVDPGSFESESRISVGIALPGSASGGDIADAIARIEAFGVDVRFMRYEVGVRYGDGNQVRGLFGDKLSAIAFLQSYAAEIREEGTS